jgi:hypothetical protein
VSIGHPTIFEPILKWHERIMTKFIHIAIKRAEKGDPVLAQKLATLFRTKRPEIWNERLKWRDMEALKRAANTDT